MKKNEVFVGGLYVAKVSGHLALVKVLSESQYGGWNGINVRTRRDVRIRSAARLRKQIIESNSVCSNCGNEAVGARSLCCDSHVVTPTEWRILKGNKI